MSKQEKRRLYIIGAILLAAVILLLLLGKRAATGAGNTVVNQGGEFSFPGVSPIELSDLPPLDIPGQRASSRGCAVCYSGYGRIIAPAVAVPPAPVTQQITYMISNSYVSQPSPPPPQPRPTLAMAFNSSPPEPRPWWEGMAPGGRAF